MPTPLTDWQRRLDGHFARLASTRGASGFPLFAFEHGLSADDLATVGELLRNSPPEDLPLGLHWLVWVVCAAEAGYEYTGGEYWPILAKYGRQWLEPIHQRRLREWFEKFQGRYQGVTPSGAWAGHFKYIAWPITHAVVPSYLQEQLAQSLFALRFRLARLDDVRPRSVGRFLAENLWDATSRLREFLQQEELVGRIVLALLNNAHSDEQSPIYPPTLKRILADLERVQSAKELLKETQRYVGDRLKTGGRTYGPSTQANRGLQGSSTEAPVSLISKARLLLQPSGPAKWSVLVEMPCLAGVARLSPSLREFVQKTRCKVAGVEGGWRPGGWLLASAQRPRLNFWPKGGAMLAQFERADEVFETQVGDALQLSEGPIWVCRIGDDGRAHEIATRLVRPGRNYILLSEGHLPTDYSHLRSCDVDCAGINVGLLSIPKTVGSDDLTRLGRLGVQVARTVRISPAGLTARAWDGEGRSAWLTTDNPCFAIVHDHPVAGYEVRLDAAPEVFVGAGPAGVPVFVSLPALRAGTHTLGVRIRRDIVGAHLSAPPADSVMTLDVREPEPWISGATAHTGMTMAVEPHDPSLDVFWEGNVGVTVLGPAGHSATAALVLYGFRGEEILRDEIGTFALPIEAEEWKRRLSPFVRAEERQWPFLEAASGRVLIRGDELGELRIPLERSVKPLRWLCHQSQNTLTLRLIDDTGSDSAARVEYSDLARPAMPVSIAAEQAREGFRVEAPGGLYEASSGPHADKVIASAPQIRGGLAGLGVRPDLTDVNHEPPSVPRLLDLLRKWSAPQLAGPLAAIRRELVFKRLLSHLASDLGGRAWAQAENVFLAQPPSEHAAQQLQRAVGASPGFLSVLRRDHERMMVPFVQGVSWFSDVATRYEISSDRGLCDFALQIAGQPHRLVSLPAPALDALLRELRTSGVLFRAARFMALVSAARNPNPLSQALPRWA